MYWKHETTPFCFIQIFSFRFPFKLEVLSFPLFLLVILKCVFHDRKVCLNCFKYSVVFSFPSLNIALHPARCLWCRPSTLYCTGPAESGGAGSD